MTNPVALVTGASVGIGEQFARHPRRARQRPRARRARPRLGSRRWPRSSKRSTANRCEVLAADLTDADDARDGRSARRATSTCSSTTPASARSATSTSSTSTPRTAQIRLNVLAVVRLTHAAAGGHGRARPRRDPERRVAGRLPADAERRDVRGDEGVRALVHAGGPRGAEGHGRRGVRARARVHAARSSRRAPTSIPKSVPELPLAGSRARRARRPRRSRQEQGRDRSRRDEPRRGRPVERRAVRASTRRVARRVAGRTRRVRPVYAGSMRDRCGTRRRRATARTARRRRLRRTT